MQAIVSDIIVNQALQSGNLQVSQLTQSISSPQSSFAELLNSIRSGDEPAPEKETSTAKSRILRWKNNDKTAENGICPSSTRRRRQNTRDSRTTKRSDEYIKLVPRDEKQRAAHAATGRVKNFNRPTPVDPLF